MTAALTSGQDVIGGRYRGLLALYPAHYRNLHGAVIRGTLLDAADANGGRPRLRELAGVAAHGLRVRTGLTSDTPIGRIAAATAPLAAASAVVMAVMTLAASYAWWGTEPGPGQFGPFYDIGALAYAGWALLAVTAMAVGGATAHRLVRIGAPLLGVLGFALLPLSALTGYQRPPLYVLGTLALFGALVVLAPSDPAQPPQQFGRVSVGAGIGLAAAFSVYAQTHAAFGRWNVGAILIFWTETYLGRSLPVIATLALIGTAIGCRRRPRWVAAVAVVSLSWLPYGYANQAWSGGGGWPAIQDWCVFLVMAAAIGAVLYGLRRRSETPTTS